MRPIKFRIYDTQRKAWVHDTDHAVNLIGETVVMGEILRRPDDTMVQLTELNDLEVMQFTGLLDKNGKEIYEGDIVDLTLHVSPYENCDDDEKSHPVIRTVARFESGSFWLTGGGYDICTHFHHDDEDREIVGNIYENPELLK